MKNLETVSNEPGEKKTPEKIRSGAVGMVEAKAAGDPVLSSQWMDNAKSFGKKGAGAMSAYGLAFSFKIAQGIYRFSKEAIFKKGNVGFGKGYEIGKNMFALEEKKDKK